jgi:two-component system, OmpR family, sensor kinase
MASTRTNLTAAFVAGLVAVSGVLGLSLWTVRNASVYRDIARNAGTEADLATGLILEMGEADQPVVIRPDTASEALTITIRLGAMLNSFPGYVVVLDRRGVPLFQSDEVRALGNSDASDLSEQIKNLPVGGAAGLLTLDGAQEQLLLVAREVRTPTAKLAKVIVGVSTQGATDLPRAYMFAFGFSALVVLLAGWGAWATLGITSQRIDTIAHDVAAISDGRSLHRRLNIENAGEEFEQLIATLNAMIERLETSFLGLRRFTADASHELKTPLMVLRAGVERALVHPGVPAEILQSLDETLAQINQMSEMVENLLTLARADEGRAPLAVEECDLRDVIGDVAETAGMLGESAGISVTSKIPSTPIPMAVDRHRIREMLLNLVTNAIKYTPPGGTVALGLVQEDGAVVFTVADTGIGIAPGDLPHIFDRFWRADPARSRTGERPGTGLGLAITKWIAEAHGGSITVQSRPGRGSVFTVRLPREGGARISGAGERTEEVSVST